MKQAQEMLKEEFAVALGIECKGVAAYISERMSQQTAAAASE